MTPDPKVFRHLLDLAGPAAPELVRRFRADLGTVRAELDRGFRTADAGLLRHALHVLIALSGTAGDPATQDAATRLHAAVRSGDDATAQALRAPVMQGIDALIALVEGAAA
jgi:hypothetical protein